MRTNLLACSLAALLAACGSQVIVPGAPPPGADAATPDAGPPPPPTDVPPPPPLDAGPPPPVALREQCLTFCRRGNERCMTTLDCDRSCDELLGAPGVGRCPAQAGALMECVARAGAYRCLTARNTFDIDERQCVAENQRFNACSDGPEPPPPPPPVDAGPSPLRPLCERACDRQARDCGSTSRSCVDGCSSIEAAAGPRCLPLAQRALACIVENGFTCGPMGSASPSPRCTALFADVQRCAGIDPPPPPEDAGPPPPPPVDAGTPVSRACASACALSDRACMRVDSSCPAECSAAEARLPSSCREGWSELLACLNREGFVCVRGSARPAAACEPIAERLAPCFMGMGGTPTPAVDAGVAPDV